MTLSDLAKDRYGGKFVFVCGYYESNSVFVLECFDGIKDRRGEDTFMVSINDSNINIPTMEVNGSQRVKRIK